MSHVVRQLLEFHDLGSASGAGHLRTGLRVHMLVRPPHQKVLFIRGLLLAELHAAGRLDWSTAVTGSSRVRR